MPETIDTELDEGAIWEAILDPAVAELGEIVGIVDLNRQSLDRVVPPPRCATGCPRATPRSPDSSRRWTTRRCRSRSGTSAATTPARSTALGVTRFGQSSSLEDVYRYHGIDTDAIIRAAPDVVA